MTYKSSGRASLPREVQLGKAAGELDTAGTAQIPGHLWGCVGFPHHRAPVEYSYQQNSITMYDAIIFFTLFLPFFPPN